MMINHPGATSQKNALISRSLLKECIDFTLGAENGTNLDIGEFAEQAGWEGHWRPITVIPRKKPTMTGNGSDSGLHRLVSTGNFNETRVLVELSGGFIAMRKLFAVD